MSDSSSSDQEEQLRLLRARHGQNRRPAPTVGGAFALPAASSKAAAFMSMESSSEDGSVDSGIDADDECGQPSEWGVRRGRSEEYIDGRGRYDRKVDGVKKRLSHAQYAYEHLQKVQSNQLGAPCTATCPFAQKCWMDFVPRLLISAHERVYGAWATRSADGLSYSCQFSQNKTREEHRALMLSWVRFSNSDPPVVDEKFFVEQRGPVCAAFACAAYDMHRCWNELIVQARRGILRVNEESENAVVRRTLTSRMDQMH